MEEREITLSKLPEIIAMILRENEELKQRISAIEAQSRKAPTGELLTLREAGKLLKMSPEILRRKIVAGKIDLIAVKQGNRYRIRRKDFEQYLEQQFNPTI